MSAPIAADRTWRLPWRRLDLVLFREACVAVAARYAGVQVRVEVEDTDTHTAFFEIPSPDELRARLSSAAPAGGAPAVDGGSAGAQAADAEVDAPADADPDAEPDADPDAWEEDEEAGGTVELSLYDMDGDGVFLSLEADASDNGLLVEEADEIADLLADRLRAEPVDL